MKVFKNKYVIGILIVVIAGLVWFFFFRSKPETEMSYRTSVAEKGDISVSVSGSGNIVVDQSANIDPTITGTVANLNVSVGDSVKEGDILFTIINDDLATAADRAFVSYQSALITKNSAEAAYKKAKIQYERDSDRFTGIEMQTMKDNLEVNKKNVEIAWAQYLSAKEDADDRTVTASIDGTINAINIENGDDLSRLSDSSNSEAPIIIGDLNTIQAEIEINEVDISDVTLGQEAVLTFSAIDDLEITGTVAKVDSLGSSDQSVVAYDVTITFETDDNRIRPGMSLSAEIITNSAQDVLVVSATAVESFNDEDFVMVLENDMPKRVVVETGISNGTETEILSGLSAGDEIIVNSSKSSSSSDDNDSGGMGGGMGGGFPGMGGGPR